jgi:hypothetical protein
VTKDKYGIYRAERGPWGIGKVIGASKWIHISALDSLAEPEMALVDQARSMIAMAIPKVAPRIIQAKNSIVKVNLKEDTVIFTESPDWDTATEPLVGDMVGCKGVNTGAPPFYIPMRDPPFIYHHKWMMVKDDYPGFSVGEAKQWSEYWENHPAVKALASNPAEKFRSKIGDSAYWQKNVICLIALQRES